MRKVAIRYNGPREPEHASRWLGTRGQSLDVHAKRKIEELLDKGLPLYIGTYAGLTFSLSKALVIEDRPDHLENLNTMMLADGQAFEDFVLDEVTLA